MEIRDLTQQGDWRRGVYNGLYRPVQRDTVVGLAWLHGRMGQYTVSVVTANGGDALVVQQLGTLDAATASSAADAWLRREGFALLPATAQPLGAAPWASRPLPSRPNDGRIEAGLSNWYSQRFVDLARAYVVRRHMIETGEAAALATFDEYAAAHQLNPTLLVVMVGWVGDGEGYHPHTPRSWR